MFGKIFEMNIHEILEMIVADRFQQLVRVSLRAFSALVQIISHHSRP